MEKNDDDDGILSVRVVPKLAKTSNTRNTTASNVQKALEAFNKRAKDFDDLNLVDNIPRSPVRKSAVNDAYELARVSGDALKKTWEAYLKNENARHIDVTRLTPLVEAAVRWLGSNLMTYPVVLEKALDDDNDEPSMSSRPVFKVTKLFATDDDTEVVSRATQLMAEDIQDRYDDPTLIDYVDSERGVMFAPESLFLATMMEPGYDGAKSDVGVDWWKVAHLICKGDGDDASLNRKILESFKYTSFEKIMSATASGDPPIFDEGFSYLAFKTANVGSIKTKADALRMARDARALADIDSPVNEKTTRDNVKKDDDAMDIDDTAAYLQIAGQFFGVSNAFMPSPVSQLREIKKFVGISAVYAILATRANLGNLGIDLSTYLKTMMDAHLGYIIENKKNAILDVQDIMERAGARNESPMYVPLHIWTWRALPLDELATYAGALGSDYDIRDYLMDFAKLYFQFTVNDPDDVVRQRMDAVRALPIRLRVIRLTGDDGRAIRYPSVMFDHGFAWDAVRGKSGFGDSSVGGLAGFTVKNTGDRLLGVVNPLALKNFDSDAAAAFIEIDNARATTIPGPWDSTFTYNSITTSVLRNVSRMTLTGIKELPSRSMQLMVSKLATFELQYIPTAPGLDMDRVLPPFEFVVAQHPKKKNSNSGVAIKLVVGSGASVAVANAIVRHHRERSDDVLHKYTLDIEIPSVDVSRRRAEGGRPVSDHKVTSHLFAPTLFTPVHAVPVVPFRYTEKDNFFANRVRVFSDVNSVWVAETLGPDEIGDANVSDGDDYETVAVLVPSDEVVAALTAKLPTLSSSLGLTDPDQWKNLPEWATFIHPTSPDDAMPMPFDNVEEESALRVLRYYRMLAHAASVIGNTDTLRVANNTVVDSAGKRSMNTDIAVQGLVLWSDLNVKKRVFVNSKDIDIIPVPFEKAFEHGPDGSDMSRVVFRFSSFNNAAIAVKPDNWLVDLFASRRKGDDLGRWSDDSDDSHIIVPGDLRGLYGLYLVLPDLIGSSSQLEKAVTAKFDDVIERRENEDKGADIQAAKDYVRRVMKDNGDVVTAKTQQMMTVKMKPFKTRVLDDENLVYDMFPEHVRASSIPLLELIGDGIANNGGKLVLKCGKNSRRIYYSDRLLGGDVTDEGLLVFDVSVTRIDRGDHHVTGYYVACAMPVVMKLLGAYVTRHAIAQYFYTHSSQKLGMKSVNGVRADTPIILTREFKHMQKAVRGCLGYNTAKPWALDEGAERWIRARYSTLCISPEDNEMGTWKVRALASALRNVGVGAFIAKNLLYMSTEEEDIYESVLDSEKFKRKGSDDDATIIDDLFYVTYQVANSFSAITREHYDTGVSMLPLRILDDNDEPLAVERDTNVTAETLANLLISSEASVRDSVLLNEGHPWVFLRNDCTLAVLCGLAINSLSMAIAPDSKKRAEIAENRTPVPLDDDLERVVAVRLARLYCTNVLRPIFTYAGQFDMFDIGFDYNYEAYRKRMLTVDLVGDMRASEIIKNGEAVVPDMSESYITRLLGFMRRDMNPSIIDIKRRFQAFNNADEELIKKIRPFVNGIRAFRNAYNLVRYNLRARVNTISRDGSARSRLVKEYVKYDMTANDIDEYNRKQGYYDGVSAQALSIDVIISSFDIVASLWEEIRLKLAALLNNLDAISASDDGVGVNDSADEDEDGDEDDEDDEDEEEDEDEDEDEDNDNDEDDDDEATAVRRAIHKAKRMQKIAIPLIIDEEAEYLEIGDMATAIADLDAKFSAMKKLFIGMDYELEQAVIRKENNAKAIPVKTRLDAHKFRVDKNSGDENVEDLAATPAVTGTTQTAPNIAMAYEDDADMSDGNVSEGDVSDGDDDPRDVAIYPDVSDDVRDNDNSIDFDD